MPIHRTAGELYLDALEAATCHLQERWPAVEALAVALLERGTLEAEGTIEIIDQAPRVRRRGRGRLARWRAEKELLQVRTKLLIVKITILFRGMWHLAWKRIRR